MKYIFIFTIIYKKKDYYQHKRNKHRKFYGVNRDDKIGLGIHFSSTNVYFM